MIKVPEENLVYFSMFLSSLYFLFSSVREFVLTSESLSAFIDQEGCTVDPKFAQHSVVNTVNNSRFIPNLALRRSSSLPPHSGRKKKEQLQDIYRIKLPAVRKPQPIP